MKKILLCICFAMLIFVATSCEKEKKVLNEVKLNGLTYVNSTKGTEENLVNTNAVGQYEIVDTGSEIHKLQISLDNRDNYEVVDYELKATNENVEILMNDNFVKLNTFSSIPWISDNNYVDIITIKIQNVDTVSFSISNVVYTDGETRATVNTEDKDKFTFYIREKVFIDYFFYQADEYVFKITKDDKTEVEDNVDGYVRKLEKKGSIKYSYKFGSIVFEYVYDYSVDIYFDIRKQSDKVYIDIGIMDYVSVEAKFYTETGRLVDVLKGAELESSNGKYIACTYKTYGSEFAEIKVTVTTLTKPHTFTYIVGGQR